MAEAVDQVAPSSLIEPELPNIEVHPGTADALIIFGNGPVIDPITREHAGKSGTVPGDEAMKFWNENMAQAAWEIFRRGDAKMIVPMGGRTGGEAYESEAGLIGRRLEELGVPEDQIQLEAESTNTLENIVNFLNLYVDVPGGIKSVDVLGASPHIGRIREMMDLFQIPYNHAFSSEEVLRFAARDQEEWDQETLQRIESHLDFNAVIRIPVSRKDKVASKDFWSTQAGEETFNVVDGVLSNEVHSSSLRELPENWLKYIARLNNWERATSILKNLGDDVLKVKFGIDLDSQSEGEIRSKLAAIERKAYSSARAVVTTSYE